MNNCAYSRTFKISQALILGDYNYSRPDDKLSSILLVEGIFGSSPRERDAFESAALGLHDQL